MNNELFKHFNILLIESVKSDADVVKKYLKGCARFECELKSVVTLNEGLQMLDEHYFDLILLDLESPTTAGIGALLKLRVETLFKDIPVIVFTSLGGGGMDILALRSGAEDCLIKGQFQADRLVQAIDYAVTRHKLRTKIKDLSLTDELTGCYNRRGFYLLAEQHLKLVQRNKKSAVLLFIDMDDLKTINDTYGHAVGDIAIAATGNLLKKDFRKSDIVGRIGGDEFAIMAIDARKEDAQTMFAHMIISVNQRNQSRRHPFRISLSMGSVCCDPAKPSSIEGLLAEADRLMYAIKQQKKKQYHFSHH